MGDVIEHLSIEDAKTVLDRLMPLCEEIVVAVPYEYKQESYDDNIFQAHKQPDLTPQIFKKDTQD